ncbi:RimK family alpha-L-glutamate ligase [Thermodesulfobacteriota bacterium]
METETKIIALEARLRDCKNVITLGVRPNFSDYSRQEADLIRKAEKIYYPTTFYADLFDAMGKKTFPSYHTYKCVQDKIKQTALFDLVRMMSILGVSGLIYKNPSSHGRPSGNLADKREIKTIRNGLFFPFIGKIARGSAMGRGVFLIQNKDDLLSYCNLTSPAYIQEYLPSDRDIRVVVIGRKIVHAYWRISPPGEFRSNVAVGGEVSLDPVPREALDLAFHTARSCQWDDVGIDICRHEDSYYVIEANMKYGREGFRRAGIDYKELMEKLIDNGEI